jgi:hypothetical protein
MGKKKSFLFNHHQVDFYFSALGTPVKTYTYTSKMPTGAMPDAGCEC